MPVCPAGPVCAFASPMLPPPAPLPLRHHRCGVGADRPAAAGPGLPDFCGGRPEEHRRRVVVDAIRYVIHNGACGGRCRPTSWRTVYGIYQRWTAAGATIALHDALRAQARLAAGHTAEPTVAVIDSQSVRAAATVPKASCGWDAAKKVNGRKRHIAVDTTGLLLEVLATSASVQDRDAARPLLFKLKRSRRRVRRAWADAVYTRKTAALGRGLPQAHRRDRQTPRRPAHLRGPGRSTEGRLPMPALAGASPARRLA